MNLDIDGVKVLSFFPGRLHLRVDRVKDDPDFAARVEREIGAVRGVKDVTVKPDDGKVLLKYRLGALKDREAVDEMFDTLGSLFPDLDIGPWRERALKHTRG